MRVARESEYFLLRYDRMALRRLYEQRATKPIPNQLVPNGKACYHAHNALVPRDVKLAALPQPSRRKRVQEQRLCERHHWFAKPRQARGAAEAPRGTPWRQIKPTVHCPCLNVSLRGNHALHRAVEYLRQPPQHWGHLRSRLIDHSTHQSRVPIPWPWTADERAAVWHGRVPPHHSVDAAFEIAEVAGGHPTQDCVQEGGPQERDAVHRLRVEEAAIVAVAEVPDVSITNWPRCWRVVAAKPGRTRG